MIYLVTGLPGNGKTLYTLWHIRERAKKENRQVFISGVPDLAIPEWVQIDEDEAKDWHTLPDGAIIVIDEAQRIFRPRAGRGDPPAHVAQLETHRHKGYDIYLITQHPSLIDQNVRRLAGTHRHIQRTFGMNRAVIHEWGEVRLNCELQRNDSSKTVWNFPKEVFSLYKSAEVHTHKVQLPKQVWYLAACIAVLVFLSVFLYKRTQQRTTSETPGIEKTETKIMQRETGELSQDTGARHPLTKTEYVAALTPRVDGIRSTAPRYDEITKPTDAPWPAACLVSKRWEAGHWIQKCGCIDQQGNRYATSQEACVSIAMNGLFKDWGERPGRKDQADNLDNRPVKAQKPDPVPGDPSITS